jgi:hypothetical protein
MLSSWLANHGRDAEGLNVVAKLISLPESDPVAQEHYQEISDAVIYEKSVSTGGWFELFKKDELGSRHRLFIACSIQGLQQLAGNNVRATGPSFQSIESDSDYLALAALVLWIGCQLVKSPIPCMSGVTEYSVSPLCLAATVNICFPTRSASLRTSLAS